MMRIVEAFESEPRTVNMSKHVALKLNAVRNAPVPQTPIVGSQTSGHSREGWLPDTHNVVRFSVQARHHASVEATG